MQKPGKGGALAAPVVSDDDFGLTRDFSEKSPWINAPGDAPASRGQVELWVRAYYDNVASLEQVRRLGDQAQGRLCHVLGTYLREIRGHSAWKTLGLPSWDAFCEQELRTSKRYANRLVAFAGAVSEAEAAFGVRKCLAGLELVEHLGLAKLGDLVPKPGAAEPPAWAQQLGASVDFAQSSAARLEQLARGLLKPALPPAPPSKKTRTVVEQRGHIVEVVVEKQPALRRLQVRSYLYRGQAHVAHKPPATEAEFAALAALYAALAKG